MSTTVWRSPSRLLIRVCGAAALTPSVESNVPLPFWSIARPPAGVQRHGPGRVTMYVPAGPKPWPTTLIATDAIPAWASDEATAHGAPFSAVAEAVAEDRDRPAARRLRPRRA